MLTKDKFTCYAKQYMDTVFRLAFNYMKNRSDADDVTQNVSFIMWMVQSML